MISFWPKRSVPIGSAKVHNGQLAICGVGCRLNTRCRSPKMLVTGDGHLDILVVAEAPGEQEDQRNTQLIGPAGQVLRDALEAIGIDLDKDCRKTNAVRCRPPKDRRPTRLEIDSCRQHILDEIKLHPPKLIIALGQVALESLIPHSFAGVGQIGQWRGFTIPDQKYGCWICPTFHPSYILRSQEGRAIRGKAQKAITAEELIFRMDLENALGKLRETFPKTPKPEIVEDWTIKKSDTITFDYETTGKRPYVTGSKILTLAFSNGEWTWAGVLTQDLAKKWKLLLHASGIKKIAHNIKFEHQWSQHCLGVETKGWLWDTMQAAHVLDNRKGICSLSRQVYLMLGVPSWKGATQEDIESGNIHVTKELLKRNALDAFYTALLARRQMEEFE